MCTRCREIKNEWLEKVQYNRSLKPNFQKRFNILFGKGQYDKAITDGEPIFGWTGTCRKCGTAFHIEKGL